MKYVAHVVAAALLLCGTASYGQVLKNVTPISKGTSVTTSAALISAANPNRVTLAIQNLDSSLSICYSLTTTTPVCGITGTYTVPAGVTHFWPNGSAPNSALYMRSASGTVVVTVIEGF